MSDRIDVSPLSPARQCASSCSLRIARPLSQRHLGGDLHALDQRRDDPDLLLHVFARAAATRRAVGVERFDFLADKHRALRRRRTGGYAKADFVGLLGGVERPTVQRSAADQIDAHVGKPGAETLANDLSGKSRARQGVGPAIADLALADVPGEIAHAYLE